ncbi:putative holin [Aeromonas phage LAh2]|uniref:Putative transglycosylase n=1 Tax=Aeromonas phage LAh1 TaxID=2591024 RepID=A0A513ZZ11_9CAUD|nr:putative transglycosylase [Aeromonas phage LAh1]QDH46322.1 putative holin [Aeromonas phage LAh2]QDH46370.1 putative holin [Aeromonas phage LAh3]QDH46420.1 putative holin [Aeromonas phage LAh4]QDH46473.1 putative holin [Aeromonas phage LAh5]
MWLVDKAGEAALAAPPAVVTGITLMGVSLQDWVYIATLFYLVILIAIKIKELVCGRRTD